MTPSDANSPLEVILDRHGAQIATTIKAIISQILSIDTDKIADAALLTEMGAESFDFVDLSLRVEREFGVRLPDTYRIISDLTVADLVRGIAVAQLERVND